MNRSIPTSWQNINISSTPERLIVVSVTRTSGLVAGGAKARARQLILVNQVYVLLQVASLVKAHHAAVVLAAERFLLGVDSEVRIEL